MKISRIYPDTLDVSIRLDFKSKLFIYPASIFHQGIFGHSFSNLDAEEGAERKSLSLRALPLVQVRK